MHRDTDLPRVCSKMDHLLKQLKVILISPTLVMKIMKIKDEIYDSLKGIIGSAKIILETYDGFRQFMKQIISTLPKTKFGYFYW